MKQTTTICDHCGKKMEDNEDEYYSFGVKLSGTIKKKVESATKTRKFHLDDFDLCEKCATEFEIWIKKKDS